MILRAVAMSIAIICSTVSYAAKPKATGSLYLQGGQAYPQKDLVEFLQPGTAYRLKLFGGAKVNVKFVGAVGLGWDFTYSEHEMKFDDNASYRRLTWDWFHLPISLGFIHFTPGLSWVLTDVDSEVVGLKETSIRPAVMLDTGISLALTSNFGVALNARASKTIIDKEKLNDGSEINIVGDYVSWFVGGFIYF